MPPNGESGISVFSKSVQPVIWRSVSPPSASEDPKPVDVNLYATFFTGELPSEKNNTFTVYLRGNSNRAFITQLDRESPPYETQKKIEEEFPGQPDYGISKYVGRKVEALEESIETLDKYTIEELDSTESEIDESWISFQVIWGNGAANNKVLIKNSTESPGYSFSFKELTANQSYSVLISLKGHTASVKIYKLVSKAGHQLGFESLPVFDTTQISDQLICS